MQQFWHRMIVFGDSLSCGPQRYSEEFPDLPDVKRTSHFGPRFSNGWTMVEYIRNFLNIPTSRFHNFATGGETSETMRNLQFPAFLDFKFDSHLGESPEHAGAVLPLFSMRDHLPLFSMNDHIHNASHTSQSSKFCGFTSVDELSR